MYAPMVTEPHTPLPSHPHLFSCNVKTGSYLRFTLRNTKLRPQETTATPRAWQCVYHVACGRLSEGLTAQARAHQVN